MAALNSLRPLTILVKDGYKHDQNEECMQAAIASFEILRDDRVADFAIKGPQIVLHLRDLSTQRVRYIQLGREIEVDGDREADIVSCAAQSVLKLLFQAGYTSKEAVSFQSRRGDFLGGDVSGISVILAAPNAKPPFTLFSPNDTDPISHTYVYFKERKLCIFLNQYALTENLLKKIETTLEKHLPRPTNMAESAD